MTNDRLPSRTWCRIMIARIRQGCVSWLRPRGNVEAIARSWSCFFQQVQCDSRLWLLGIGLLQLFRLVLMLVFWHRITIDSRWSDYALVFLVGLRFDAQTAAWFVAPSFLMSVACLFRAKEQLAQRVRTIGLCLLIVTCVIVGGVDLGYFHEFHDQFNHYIFGALYDDFSAVLATVWKQHPIVWELLGIIGVIAVLIPVGRRWVTFDWLRQGLAERMTRTWTRRLLVLTLSVVAFTCALRGSVRSRPVQMKDAAITRDPVLNKMVMNPFSAARYAITGQWKLTGGQGLDMYLPDGDVRHAAQTVAAHDEPLANVDDAFRRVAKGSKGCRPKHVFVILMESYDAWPTLERYQSLGLSERLLDLGRRGIFSRKFLSASNGTMASFAALLTGLMDGGVITNYQPLARQAFPTSINPICQRLGMRTRMFLGGYFSWQRSDAFCVEQGFQEIYAAPHYSQGASSNEWGPDDRELFDFVLRAVDPHQPSVNVVMTSSYHPPHSVDVYANGFPHREVPDDLKSIYSANPDYLRVLGHLWYADQKLGEFVEAAERKYPDSLFVITGDHTSRRFLNSHPTLYERMAVPFVMYGPSVLKDIDVPTDIVGSHHDIMPTVFELLAPQGFVYHAIGHDLLDPQRPQIAFGRDTIAGRDFIASRIPGGEIEPLPGTRLPSALPDLPRLQAEYKSMLGMAWWRICRGSEFPDPKSESASETRIARDLDDPATKSHGRLHLPELKR